MIQKVQEGYAGLPEVREKWGEKVNWLTLISFKDIQIQDQVCFMRTSCLDVNNTNLLLLSWDTIFKLSLSAADGFSWGILFCFVLLFRIWCLCNFFCCRWVFMGHPDFFLFCFSKYDICGISSKDMFQTIDDDKQSSVTGAPWPCYLCSSGNETANAPLTHAGNLSFSVYCHINVQIVKAHPSIYGKCHLVTAIIVVDNLMLNKEFIK